MKSAKTGILFFTIYLSFSCESEKMIRHVNCYKSDIYADSTKNNTDSLCNNDLCANYQTIWKNLIVETNNLSTSYFDNHIEMCQSNISEWNDGLSFTICYKVKLNWAIAYKCDQFIIKIKNENSLYPTLNLPRDSYLSKEQVQIAVNNRAFSSEILKLSNNEALKFKSMSIALSLLIENAKVNTLCFNGIDIDKTTGNLMLCASAQYENEINNCIQAKIDLVTGESFVTESPCFIE